MSAAAPDGSHEKKRRRVPRACDMCRLKRVRCEGGQMSHRACSKCVSNQYDCTYTQVLSKKSNSDKVYIESLEGRLAKMEAILKQIAPQNDIFDVLDDPVLNASSPFFREPHTTENEPSFAAPEASTPTPPVDTDDLDPSDNEISARRTLEESFRSISLDPGEPHFFGKSSSFMFIQKAMDIRQEYLNETSGSSTTRESTSVSIKLPNKRSEFWNIHPWLKNVTQKHEFTFPPDDLMLSLIDIYFHRFNAYSPLLHRPTFEQSVREGLHLRDDAFASLVLLVCALGARYVPDDPRVLLDGFSDSRFSAGWKWFRQAQLAFQFIDFEPTGLYDLQIISLFASFLAGSSSAQVSWPVIGFGLRLAQARGAHRKKVYDNGPTVETELLKRVFWLLVMQDRSISSALGRPCGIQDEDFDVDLPLECDDEYWINEDTNLAFKQPVGQPSKIAFLNCSIRLGQIHAFALRTIYSINKSKANFGRAGHDWEERTVSELDSALNNFVDSIPEHLRWNPYQENMLFLNQSALLYTRYYDMQITVHRPFIPSPGKPSRFPFPSLAICTNAARSSVHVLDVQRQRLQKMSPEDRRRLTIGPLGSMFNAGTVLLLNIWAGKRSGTAIDHAKEMSEVHKVMRMLKDVHGWAFAAGRLWDILHEMASVAEVPLSPPEQMPSNKRARNHESEGPFSPLSQLRDMEGPAFTSTESIANLTDHTNHAPDPHPSRGLPSGTGTFSSFSLPMSSQELGSLPVYLQMSPVAPPAIPADCLSDQLAGGSVIPTQTPYDPALSTAEMVSSSSNQYPPTAYDNSTIPQDAQSLLPVDLNNETSSREQIASSADNPASPDMLEMWSTVPTGFEWADWEQYITNFSGPSTDQSRFSSF